MSNRICIVSDFFCPNTGGVESHIYYLSQCLLRRGHTVIVVTHAYGKRRGIRFLSNNLKVYYLPFIEFYNGCVLPTVFGSLSLLRHVFVEERVEIVHGHSSFSALAHEAMFHAQLMGLRTVFTDHSLFGFADLSSILTNKLLQFSLTNCDHVICVSYTSKANTVLRAHLPPDKVTVVPNAIDSDMFCPGILPQRQPPDRVTVVVVSRLVYRKGIDLLAALIPKICNAFPYVHFLIAGDGPKRIVLEEVREKHKLQERVLLLGFVPHTCVRNVLIRGQIFLNTSLTEAFCMAIVEAASCGLHVVSTNVGGIPEVLPPDMISLAAPNVADLTASLQLAVETCAKEGFGNPWSKHYRIRRMYLWSDVAKRTEAVYYRILNLKPLSVGFKLKRYFHCGAVFGIFFIFIAALDYLFICLSNRSSKSIHKNTVDLKREKVRGSLLNGYTQHLSPSCSRGSS